MNAHVVIPFPSEECRAPRPPRRTHEVFVRRWITRTPRGRRRDKWSVEESSVDGDWWGFVSDAADFDAAVRIAIDHVEPGGVIIFDDCGEVDKDGCPIQ